MSKFLRRVKWFVWNLLYSPREKDLLIAELRRQIEAMKERELARLQKEFVYYTGEDR